MKLLRFWLVLLVVLAGCGGGGGVGVAVGEGGGVGSGGTGAQASSAVSIGSIDGFGSIIVNGIRFDVDTAEIRLADASELALGMTVAVNGVVDASLATGTATAVTSSAELQGTVSAVDRAGRAFSVGGVAVSADNGTAYGGLADFAALAAGDTVRIYGLPAAGSALRATRIERLQAGAVAIVTGSLTNLDRGNRQFRVGERVVSYAAASLDAALGTEGPREGQIVRVRGTGPATATAVLEATAVERWYGLAAAEGTRASVAGVVSDYEGPASLRVQGQRVDASRATVRGGTLGNGARAEVTGTVQGEVLVASQVRVRREESAGSGPGAGPGGGDDDDGEPPRFSAEGTIRQFRGPDSFRVDGQDINAAGTGVTFSGGTAADLAAGRRVKVTGSRVSRGVLVAQTVAFEPQEREER